MPVADNDMYQLSQDPTFQNRVQASLTKTCVSIANEGWTVAFHRERATFVTTLLAGMGPSNVPNWVQLFTGAVACDTNVINDATANGTTALTTGNRATQAALVTDAHIDAAIASCFNAFIRVPGS